MSSAPLEMPRGKLLVVDDNLDLLDSMQLVLEDMGQAVDIAACGAEALARVRAGGGYDLVLCDVGMPEMNGWQVAQAIRGLAPDTKLFLLTGVADQIPSGDPKRRLVDGVLPKPIELELLEQIIAGVLAGR